MGILGGVPVALTKVLLKKIKIVGVVFTVGVFGICVYISLVNAAIMEENKINQWGITYALSFLLDIFFS
jgi:hypothetical protein